VFHVPSLIMSRRFPSVFSTHRSPPTSGPICNRTSSSFPPLPCPQCPVLLVCLFLSPDDGPFEITLPRSLIVLTRFSPRWLSFDDFTSFCPALLTSLFPLGHLPTDPSFKIFRTTLGSSHRLLHFRIIYRNFSCVANFSLLKISSD